MKDLILSLPGSFTTNNAGSVRQPFGAMAMAMLSVMNPVDVTFRRADNRLAHYTVHEYAGHFDLDSHFHEDIPQHILPTLFDIERTVGFALHYTNKGWTCRLSTTTLTTRGRSASMAFAKAIVASKANDLVVLTRVYENYGMLVVDPSGRLGFREDFLRPRLASCELITGVERDEEDEELTL